MGVRPCTVGPNAYQDAEVVLRLGPFAEFEVGQAAIFKELLKGGIELDSSIKVLHGFHELAEFAVSPSAVVVAFGGIRMALDVKVEIIQSLRIGRLWRGTGYCCQPVSIQPPFKPYVRVSRIRLNDDLLGVACAE